MIQVGVVGHPGYVGLRTVLDDLLRLADELHLRLYFEEELHAVAGAGERMTDPEIADVLLTLGGDGTLLRGARLLADHKQLLVVEEGTVANGFGAFMAAVVARLEPGVRVVAHGVPDAFIEHAARAVQLAQCGLDAAGIAERVRALHGTEALAG